MPTVTFTFPEAPPHTRGWTLTCEGQGGRQYGSPAHAGMDRRHGGGGSTTSRLPRTRGDGPNATVGPLRVNQAPPHTRGWTLAGQPRRRCRTGSPAHAGMDPSHRHHDAAERGLPRTRGDGPSTLVMTFLFLMAPPHTRGWTRITGWRSSALWGSPAHAGMDPAPPPSTPTGRRLPRTRGDGP